MKDLPERPNLRKIRSSHEGDTRHVAASFQESKQQEQYQHLRDEIQEPRPHRRRYRQESGRCSHSAALGGFKAVADQNRNAGYPSAVGGRIRRAVGFLIFCIESYSANSMLHRSAFVTPSTVSTAMCFFIYNRIGNAGVSRGTARCHNVFQCSLCSIFGRSLRFPYPVRTTIASLPLRICE